MDLLYVNCNIKMCKFNCSDCYVIIVLQHDTMISRFVNRNAAHVNISFDNLSIRFLVAQVAVWFMPVSINTLRF